MSNRKWNTFAEFRQSFGLDDSDPAFHVNLPEILYKYRSFKSPFTQRMIESGEYFFPSASNLNDPFEFDTYLRDTDAPRDANKLNEYILGNKSLVEAEDRGIFSLSSVSDNILMWSHYGDSHRGICVGLDTDCLLRSLTRCLGGPNNFELLPVTYVNKFEGIFDSPSNEDSERVVRRILTTKSTEWAYEKEFRVIIKNKKNISLPIGRKEKSLVGLIYLSCWFQKNDYLDLLLYIEKGCREVEIRHYMRHPSQFSLIDRDYDNDFFML